MFSSASLFLGLDFEGVKVSNGPVEGEDGEEVTLCLLIGCP